LALIKFAVYFDAAEGQEVVVTRIVASLKHATVEENRKNSGKRKRERGEGERIIRILKEKFKVKNAQKTKLVVTIERPRLGGKWPIQRTIHRVFSD
jgi:hypothetical protein